MMQPMRRRLRIVSVDDVKSGDEASGERVSGGWFATPRARNETRESSWMMERHRPRGVSGVGSNRVVESVGECRRMSENVGRNGVCGLFERRFRTGLAPQLLKSDSVASKDEPRFVERNPPETHGVWERLCC